MLIGNEKLMKEKAIFYEPCKSIGTVVYVAGEGKFLGSIVIADTVKDGAKEAIASMKKVGVKKCVMLTGDRKEAAEGIAAELGIDEVHAELLPQDKVCLLYTSSRRDLKKNLTKRDWHSMTRFLMSVTNMVLSRWSLCYITISHCQSAKS